MSWEPGRVLLRQMSDGVLVSCNVSLSQIRTPALAAFVMLVVLCVIFSIAR